MGETMVRIASPQHAARSVGRRARLAEGAPVWIHAKRALRWIDGRPLAEVGAFFSELMRKLRDGEDVELPDWVSLTEPRDDA